MKVIFLSHQPHEVHFNFAQKINARIKIIPFFGKFVTLIKKYHFLCHVYLIISLVYSFFIRVKEDVLLIDGGSSLYLATFLKMRKKKLKIIYLDVDLLFYNRFKSGKSPSFFLKPCLKMIDAVISISEQNKSYVTKFLNVPIEVCLPYPKKLRKEKIKRKNYGLYVGRLDPDKNIKRIINFAIQCPYFEKFIIVGNGALKRYVVKISKKYKKLVYLRERKNVAKYYSKCKFLIHLPDSDPHPCSTMEATICGCYPIISKGVGTNYLFDKIFIINEPNNFNEINRRIKYIFDNKQKIKKLLKKSIPKILTKEQSLKTFENKFNKIIGQIYGQI